MGIVDGNLYGTKLKMSLWRLSLEKENDNVHFIHALCHANLDEKKSL